MMANILEHDHRTVLQRFAQSNTLLAFDFDGTLSPIVVDPERARVRPQTRRLLVELCKRYPVIVISGRTRADTSKRLEGLDIVEVVGNHGLEPWYTSEHFAHEVERWSPILEASLSSLSGVMIEQKGFSVSIHYRKSDEKKRARAAILKAVGLLGDVRVVGGKQVVNVLPAGAPHKGIALERERERLRCERAIYIGDDETDEDAFALREAERILTIRVGEKHDSAAEHWIHDQTAIDTLLRALVELRPADAAS